MDGLGCHSNLRGRGLIEEVASEMQQQSETWVKRAELRVTTKSRQDVSEAGLPEEG